MDLGWWRRKRDCSSTKVEVERVATEAHGEQRHDRVVISAYPKVVDRKDRTALVAGRTTRELIRQSARCGIWFIVKAPEVAYF